MISSDKAGVQFPDSEFSFARGSLLHVLLVDGEGPRGRLPIMLDGIGTIMRPGGRDDQHGRNDDSADTN